MDHRPVSDTLARASPVIVEGASFYPEGELETCRRGVQGSWRSALPKTIRDVLVFCRRAHPTLRAPKPIDPSAVASPRVALSEILERGRRVERGTWLHELASKWLSRSEPKWPSLR